MEPEPNKVTVKVCGISFGYNGKNTLNDIDLECKSGEFIGLIGPNGSGKTTLLRCINGVLKPKMGTILVDGNEKITVSSKGAKEAVEIPLKGGTYGVTVTHAGFRAASQPEIVVTSGRHEQIKVHLEPLPAVAAPPLPPAAGSEG